MVVSKLEELAARYPYSLDTIIDLHKHLGYTNTEKLLAYARNKAMTELELTIILRFIRAAYLKGYIEGYIGSTEKLTIGYTFVRKS